MPDAPPLLPAAVRGDRWRLWLATWGGLGLLPFAPGTFGSAGALLFAVLLQLVFDGLALAWVWTGCALLLLLVGCRMTAFIDRGLGGCDPGCFVLDEVVGLLLALAMFAFVYGEPSPWILAAGFGLFRLFDIAKLPPVRQLEAIPGAAGVMLDDVAAGLQAGLILLVLPQLGVA